MMRKAQLLLALTGVCVLLMGTALTAWAGHPPAGPGTDAPQRMPAAARTPTPTPSGEECTSLEFSDPAKWYTVDADNKAELDNPVVAYPSGTTAIAAGFDYTCVPPHTYIVVAFRYGSLDAEPSLVKATYLRASAQPDSWWNSFYYNDGSPVPDGDWYVEFYRNINEPLAAGQITVGGDGSPTYGEITVQGTVVDAKTKKPVKGAEVSLLNPGASLQDWADEAYNPDDVYSSGQSDAKGEFVCDPTIQRNVPYTLVVRAKGYKTYSEQVKVDDQQEDPLELSIKLSK